ncbi:subclass B3 metallo-beta-lactamase [Parvularcula sp. LCG005]|uniref:subclass B3 metallo-beta-lactamase n=1 Tax=Parvularcula sp. LCG005 TaxID=3078805 RepID=UPI002942E9B2|nr:subclass B3 metallo-beta-lactamase [Parvularcula sp. LCG005]WOI54244.1 subclass B3 metallo-beta-lactamase [Parvularcula sp. LCG005]
MMSFLRRKAPMVSLLALCAACATEPLPPKPAPPLPFPMGVPSAFATENPSWVTPTAPFKIADNIYYVGTEGLAVYLISTLDGLILLDGGMPGYEQLIVDSIESLGFDIDDVRVLLNSHAHFDHSGGLAMLQAASGAELIASEGDRSALENGFYLGDEDDPNLAAPPIKVSRTIADGQSIDLGGTRMTAHITPGHTRGCTSWTMTVRLQRMPTDVLFFCSATVAGNSLVPPQYDGIVDDYRETFDKTRNWKPDIFLSNHPQFFGMTEKRARLAAGDEAAFIDRETFPAMMTRLEAAFESRLAEEQSVGDQD